MTAAEQAQIDQIERDRRRREAALLALLLLMVGGEAPVGGVTRHNRRSALRFATDAIHMGSDPAEAIGPVILGSPALHLPGLAGPMGSATVEAWQAGLGRTLKHAEIEPAPKPPPPTEPPVTPLGPGVSTAWQIELPQRPPPPEPPPMPPDEVALRRWLQSKADEATRNLYASLQTMIRDAVADARARGLTTPQIAKAVKDAFVRYGYTAKPPQSVNPDSTGSPGFALVAVATNEILAAYNAGSSKAMERPDVAGKLVALRHRSVIDERTSEYCDEFSGRDGLTLSPNDPYWAGNWPPLHGFCRSIVLPVFDEDVEFSTIYPLLPPAPGWGERP